MSTLNNVSILCVENFIDSLELLRLSLEMQGAKVHAAVSAEAALQAIAANPVDILISDLALPQADGIALLKALRTQSSIPAIALTGISDPTVREKALAAGFDRYFVKPVDDVELIEVIATLVKKNRKRSA